MMKLKVLISFYLLIIAKTTLAEDIDLNLNKWHTVKYSKIKPNVIKQIKKSIEISVNNSSSALVFKFDQIKVIRRVKIKAKLKGLINYHGSPPGSEDADDFPLRVGFILKGNKKLNFFQKRIAPDWLVQLDKISSTNGGLDKVHSLIFYTENPKFKKREHPLSSYFFEEAATQFIDFKLDTTHSFLKELEIIGIWLSSDGDDTKSSFSVIIESIVLN